MANDVQLIHSQRIGASTAAITYTEDGKECYVWTKTGRTKVVDGINQGRVRCSGCKSVNDQNGGRAIILSLKFNLQSIVARSCFCMEVNNSLILFLRHCILDNDMLIFSSRPQLILLLNCSHLISDGTFKYAPKGTKQIYRIFGLIKQTHATPLVTVLMTGKSKVLYKRMWQKGKQDLWYIWNVFILVKEALLEINIVHSIRFANFDAEIAAYSSFSEVFPGVAIKLCSFHVKQGLYRKVC